MAEHEHTCDCGHPHEHAHHHEHGEHCACGHDHHHEHHHEHGEHCGCGHDHHHEHHHEHDAHCDCGHGHHEHHHEHGEHCDCGHDHHHEEASRVGVTHHEGALIGSIHGQLHCADFAKAQAILTEQIHLLGQHVTEAGGIIGHIKYILNGPSHCCQISLTDTAESVRYFDNDVCQVEGVAIVFCVEEKALCDMIEDTLGTILE